MHTTCYLLLPLFSILKKYCYMNASLQIASIENMFFSYFEKNTVTWWMLAYILLQWKNMFFSYLKLKYGEEEKDIISWQQAAAG